MKHRLLDVGIWVKESQHGYKFGREAVETLIRFAFEDLGLRQLYFQSLKKIGRVVKLRKLSGKDHQALGSKKIYGRDL